MITKEKFFEAIEVLKQQQETDDNFETHMEAAFPGSYAPIYDNHLWGLSIKLLGQLMEDPYEYIDWWIYETDYGKREDMCEISWTEDGKEVSVQLTTAEKLYDFLVENAKHPSQPSEPIQNPNVKTLTMDEFLEIMKQHILHGKY